MTTIHIMEPNGAAKCGANVYKHYEMINGAYTFIEKRVGKRRFLYFENAEKGHVANCKRCLNTINRPETAAISEDMTGTIFHRSYGYDMTINEFCRVIKHTAKGLLVQMCSTRIDGDPLSPGATARASAGKPTGKSFIMLKKHNPKWKYDYWTGGGQHWRQWDGRPCYENHLD